MHTTSPADNAALLRRLQALKEDCIERGFNKPDQLSCLIPACIDEGVATGPEIISTLAQLDYNRQFAGIQLGKNIGRFWQRDGERFYTALPPLA